MCGPHPLGPVSASGEGEAEGRVRCADLTPSVPLSASGEGEAEG